MPGITRLMRPLTQAFTPPTALRVYRAHRRPALSSFCTTSTAVPRTTSRPHPDSSDQHRLTTPRNLRKGDTFDLQISKIAYGGASVGYLPPLPFLDPREVGMPVYAPKGACPGDVTSCQITKVRRRGTKGGRSYAEAVFAKLETASPQSVEVPCKHFGNYRLGGGGCGGCTSMHVPYAMQAGTKQAQIEAIFDNLCQGQVKVGPIVQCEHVFAYRNKMEFSFGRRWYEVGGVSDVNGMKGHGDNEYALGLHAPGRFDKVIRIGECFIQNEVGNHILAFVTKRCKEMLLEPFDARLGQGYMRNLVIRTATNAERDLEVMVNFVTSPCDVPHRLTPLAVEIREKFPEVVCVVQNICGVKGTHVVEEDMERLLSGDRKYIEQHLGGMTFRISPNSFFQTNAEQSELLYDEVRKAAKITENESVLDLYCGTGTIGLTLSSAARKVIGFDVVPSAIADARLNAQINGITNAEFHQANLDKLSSMMKSKSVPETDVIVVDPPRAGLHPDLVKYLAKCAAKRIIYVSCNPASQVRDLAMLLDISPDQLKITSIQPVDMFPHTPHVECVVAIERV
eukprot:GFKZ01009364.1.p2 GENE.GFKZ01009364.1~~GFKZ01009364.1.p2  ORF type:complete len:567 (-),score=61.13 GFKZ01009364.1:2150-3850(-)